MKSWKKTLNKLDSTQVDSILKANQVYIRRSSITLEGKKGLLLDAIEKRLSKGEKVNIPDDVLRSVELSSDSMSGREMETIRGEQNHSDEEKTFVSSSLTQTSTYTGLSGMAKIQTTLSNVAVSLQDKKRITTNKYFILILFMNIYQIWVSVFLPLLGVDFHYGQDGSWVKVVTYPITLSLELVSYDVIVALAFISLCFVLLHLIMSIVTYRSVSNSSKSSKIIKNVSFFMNFVLVIGNLVFMYIFSSFFDCSSDATLKIDELQATNALIRYNMVACYQTPNVIFMSVFLASSVLLLVSTFIASSVACNVHPMHKSWFKLENSSTQVLLNVFNCLEVMITFLIPNTTAYIRSIIHIVLSVVWIYAFWISMPYFKRIENSIYAGVGGAKLGIAIGTIISFFVNPNNETVLGLGMMGLTLGLGLIGFISGFTIFEVYTRVLLYRVAKKIGNELGGDSFALYQQFEDSNSLRILHLFLRFSIGGHKYDGMGISFAKAVASNRNFSNSELLLTCALLIAYRWEENGYLYSLFLLKKATKTSNNFLLKLNLTERTREVEVDQTRNSKSSQNFIEIKHIIDKLEKGKDELKSLHKHFWKELVNEFPNMEKLDQINRRMTDLTVNIGDTYDNLMSNYSKEIVVVRNYATFLENFKFDKENAAALYQEASRMDEDNHSKQREKETSKMMNSRKASITISHNSEGEGIVDPMNDDSFSGIESRDVSKKEVIIKAAIKTNEQRKGQYVSFVLFTFFSFAVVSVCLALAIAVSTQAGITIPFVYALCKPSTSSIGMMREVRMRQNMDVYRNLGFIFTETLKSYSDMAIAEHKSKIYGYRHFLQEVMTQAQQQKFSTQMYKDFTNSSLDIFLPAVPNNFTQLNFISVLPKKASILELTNLLSGVGKNFYSWTNYNSTVQDFDFMYMWQNMIIARDAYVKFCTTTIDNSSSSMTTFFNIFLIVFGCFSGGYCLSFVVYLTVMRIDMSKCPKLIKIFAQISKNALGKIYHQLGSKNDEDATIHLPKSSLTQARNLYVFYGILILLIIILSTGLMVLETKMNIDLAFRTTMGIQSGTSVLRVVHGITLIIGEYFAYMGLPKSHFNDDYMTSSHQLELYHSQIKSLMDQLFADWSLLIYGGGEATPSVGKYATVDLIIQGISNCSQHFNTNSSDILTQWKYCEGLENMISFLTTQTAKFNEQVFNPLFQQDVVTMFDMYLSLFVNTNILSDRVLKFLDYFVQYTTSPSMVISIVSAVVAYLALSFLLYAMFMALESNRNQLINLRNMFHYVPVDLIDSTEVIRNFILYNYIPSIFDVSKMFKRKKKNKVGSSNDEDSKVRSILNASVEGAVLVDAAGFVDLINPAAQRMFGCKQSEIVGTQLVSLIDPDSHETIKKTIFSLKENSKKTRDNNGGESLELECVRKNGSKFPVKLNIFAVVFDNVDIVICFIKDTTAEKKHNAILAEEKAKSDGLLRNILPEAVATRLKQGETFIAEKFTDITCFFSDMVGFTRISSDMNPTELVGMLNFIVNGFDNLTDRYMLEKIKTIGDAYFCVGGLHHQATSDHPERVLGFAMSVFNVLREYNSTAVEKQINIRIGIHTGPCVAGVIGVKKFAYDLWGDTINFASRMESNSLPGRIQVSRSCYERVHDLNYEWEERKLDIKGKGVCSCYLLDSKHHAKAIVEDEEVEVVKL